MLYFHPAATSDDTPLDYEIEYWNAAEGKALVWVKVDEIIGNSDNQYIIMRYGNQHAASLSNGAAVFGNDNDFAAVSSPCPAGSGRNSNNQKTSGA